MKEVKICKERYIVQKNDGEDAWLSLMTADEIVENVSMSDCSGISVEVWEQTATAVNRLVNMWFQNGDTYDNVRTVLYGGLNDLSPCANWLYMYRPESRAILDRIPRCCTLLDYEGILTSLADLLLDEQAMETASQTLTQGSIYKCKGPFACRWPE